MAHHGKRLATKPGWGGGSPGRVALRRFMQTRQCAAIYYRGRACGQRSSVSAGCCLRRAEAGCRSTAASRDGCHGKARKQRFPGYADMSVQTVTGESSAGRQAITWRRVDRVEGTIGYSLKEEEGRDERLSGGRVEVDRVRPRARRRYLRRALRALRRLRPRLAMKSSAIMLFMELIWLAKCW